MSQHIAAGKGVKIYHNQTHGKSIPMINFPPLYAAVLAIGSILGFSQQFFATYWNLFCIFLNLLLAGFLIYKATQHLLPALAGIFLIGCDRNILEFSNYVLTESSFLPLCLSIALLLFWFLHKQRVFILILVGVCIGIATLVRFIGITFIPGALIVFFLFSPSPLLRRLRDGILLASTSALPLLCWVGLNHLFYHTSYDKGLPGVDASRYFFKELFENLIDHVTNYVVQNGFFASGGGWFVSMIFMTGLALVGRHWFRKKTPGDTYLAAMIVWILALTYLMVLGFILGWRHLANVTDPIRYLLPAYNLFWIFTILVFWGALQNVSGVLPISVRTAVRSLFYVVGFLFLMHAFAQANYWVQLNSIQGIGDSNAQSWKFISGIHWFPQRP